MATLPSKPLAISSLTAIDGINILVVIINADDKTPSARVSERQQ